MGDLTGRSALVTGGAQGIGFGIALELARAGSRVVIGDKNLAQGRMASAELTKQGHEVIALGLDVTDAQSVRDCVAESIKHFSRIDILVNNAGIHCETIGQPSTIDQFNRCFDVNLYGVWRVSQVLVSHFREHGGGRIINIASINGRIPWADTPAYSASKAAILNLTQSMAVNLGADNINVNAVCPGGIMTSMADAFTQDRQAFEDGNIRTRPLKRPLLAEDIGHAVVFFASSRSRNITGQALNVDGGAVMN
jgi:NAD(P)-dependent dehydrogenase (short-subunit alcohol dehydrogenase family)